MCSLSYCESYQTPVICFSLEWGTPLPEMQTTCTIFAEKALNDACLKVPLAYCFLSPHIDYPPPRKLD